VSRLRVAPISLVELVETSRRCLRVAPTSLVELVDAVLSLSK
jgi:hypothetical protein